jgi:hypothetical protein
MEFLASGKGIPPVVNTLGHNPKVLKKLKVTNKQNLILMIDGLTILNSEFRLQKRLKS